MAEELELGKVIEELEVSAKEAEQLENTFNDASEAIQEAESVGQIITESSEAESALTKAGKSVLKLAGFAEEDMESYEKFISKGGELIGKGVETLGGAIVKVGKYCLSKQACVGGALILGYMIAKGISDPAAAAAEMAGDAIKAFFYALFGQTGTYILWGFAGLAGLIILIYVIKSLVPKKGNGGGSRS